MIVCLKPVGCPFVVIPCEDDLPGVLILCKTMQAEQKEKDRAYDAWLEKQTMARPEERAAARAEPQQVRPFCVPLLC